MLIDAATKSSGSSTPFFLFLILIVAALYFIVLRPRQKRSIAQRQKQSDVQVGDDVLTAGGIYGRVMGFDEDEVRVEVAPKVELRVARRAIAAILTEHEPEPEHDAADEDAGGETWQSAFDEDAGGGDSAEEKPG